LFNFQHPIPSEVSRGNISCRRDPRDKHEWQFSLNQEIHYKDTQHRHQISFEGCQKAEALEWIRAKNIGSMLEGTEGHLGEDALNEVLPDKEKKKGKAFWPSTTKKVEMLMMKRMGRLIRIS
jgi:hypothetical protein